MLMYPVERVGVVARACAQFVLHGLDARTLADRTKYPRRILCCGTGIGNDIPCLVRVGTVERNRFAVVVPISVVDAQSDDPRVGAREDGFHPGE